MSDPLRSVHITNYYHKDSGGISTSYNNLMEAAERHRRHVRLIVPGETESVEDVNSFARIYYVPAKLSPVFDRRYRVMMPWQYMVHGSIIRRILLEERPDIIEVTDKYTLTILSTMIRTGYFSLLGRPMLVHFSSERMDDNIRSFLIGGPVGSRFAWFVMRNYNLPIFDFHVANSAYTAAEFNDALRKADGTPRGKWFLNKTWRLLKAPRVPQNDRVFVCPRGVDAGQYSPEKRSPEARRELLEAAGFPDGSTILLYAGRVSPEKNIGLLVDLMKNLAKDTSADHRLLVVGAGPKAEWLQRQSERYLGGRIVQVGHVDKETLASFYANADVFIHPNPREPFGLAPLEAMASGLPVVAPNSGGVLSYANDGNAWLCEPTADAFAAAVNEIANNAELRRAKTARALATVKENTCESATDHLFATYDKMHRIFVERNELFTDLDAARGFNYADVVN